MSGTRKVRCSTWAGTLYNIVGEMRGHDMSRWENALENVLFAIARAMDVRSTKGGRLSERLGGCDRDLGGVEVPTGQ
jgi:hypothetical protein